MPGCCDGVSNRKLFKMFSEHVWLAFWTGCARLVLLGDGGQHAGVPLDGCPLHVMFDATQTTHLFPTSGTTWAAVDQQGHGRAVAGALLGALGIQHQDPSMHVGGFSYKGLCSFLVVGGDAATQRPFAEPGQCDGLFDIVVRHHGADGAKRLDFMNCHGLMGLV